MEVVLHRPVGRDAATAPDAASLGRVSLRHCIDL